MPRELLCVEEWIDFLAVELRALALNEPENTPSPAARSSEEARCVAFRSLIRIVPGRALKLLLAVRRNFARQINRRNAVGILATKHLKGDVLAVFQA